MKKYLAKLFAHYIVSKNEKWIKNPHQAQRKTFQKLIQTATNTQFGKDHNYESIQAYKDFQDRVPIRDYEGLRSYVDKL